MCARIEFASVIAIPLPFNGREAKMPFTTYTVQRQTKEVASRFREAFKALLSIQRIVPLMFRRSCRGFDRPCAHRSWWHEMCILLMNVLKCYLVFLQYAMCTTILQMAIVTWQNKLKSCPGESMNYEEQLWCIKMTYRPRGKSSPPRFMPTMNIE